MQGTKVVIWVLVGSLAATALMFGAASLIRARGNSVSSVIVERSTASRAAKVTNESEYVRLCRRGQWKDYTNVWVDALVNSQGLDRELDEVTSLSEMRRLNRKIATYREQVNIAMVLDGKSWPEIFDAEWPEGWVSPTRREMAETVEWCVRELTPEGERWIAGGIISNP